MKTETERVFTSEEISQIIDDLESSDKDLDPNEL